MDIFDGLSALGGLCLFLFGMSIMAEALQRRAGGRLGGQLRRMTRSRWAGFFTGLAVTAAVLCLLVRQQQPQLGGLCAAAAGVMLLLAALEQLADVREVFARLTGMAGIEEGYLNTLVKVLGVSYVAELAAQTCQDLGEGGLALKVGLVGKLCVFTLTAPMLLSLLEMILELTP